ncbi:MAG: DUF1993 domain-containing protein [Pseudolabrys sp.]|jgi:hypothetical protein
MAYTMSQTLIPICVTELNALTGVIDKAVAHATAKKTDPAILLGWRLAPDMFSFTRQVQTTCDQAKNGASRLAGIDPPKFEDNETTIDQLKDRIARTLTHLKSLDAATIDASADRDILFPLGPKKAKMKGADYLNHFVLPNFFFHMTAAYAVARNFGADVGKRDFLGAIPLTLID